MLQHRHDLFDEAFQRELANLYHATTKPRGVEQVDSPVLELERE